MFDPQTSGGLLIAVPEGKAAALSAALISKGVGGATEIGRITASGTGGIRLRD